MERNTPKRATGPNPKVIGSGKVALKPQLSSGISSAPLASSSAPASAPGPRPIAKRPMRRVKRSPRSSSTNPSFIWRMFNLVARVLAWTTIINVLFRCPNSLEECNEKSPLLCKQYFQVKQTVLPILQPHYKTHVAPYVAVAKPYYDTVDSTVLTPARSVAVKYAAPHLQQSSKLVQQQWDHLVAPQLTKAQQALFAKYDQTIAPHVKTAKHVASPLVTRARTGAMQTYKLHLLPAYNFAQPQVLKGYGVLNAFTTATVLPSAIWAANQSYIFLDTAVFPKMRLFYVDAIEPQLLRIGQRLGRHNGKVLKPDVSEKATSPEKVAAGLDGGLSSLSAASSAASTFLAATASSLSETVAHATSQVASSSSSALEKMKSKATSASSKVSSKASSLASSLPLTSSATSDSTSLASTTSTLSALSSDLPASPSPVAPPDPSSAPSPGDDHPSSAVELVATRSLLVQPPPVMENETERRHKARIEITNDMISWQERFIDAAESGVKEMDDKVAEICQQMLEQEVNGIGKQALARFDSSFNEALSALRLEIINIVETEPNKKEAMEKVTAAVRTTGLSLKAKAEDVREWRQRFERDLHASINKAAHSHFSLVDDIHDLATQKIGMKWAWMDGVTWKDWKLYHAMKAAFTESRKQMEEKVTSHEALENVVGAAYGIEDELTVRAKDAALKLKELKEVGHWKVIADDSSVDFDPDRMRAAAEAAKQPAPSGATEQVVLEEQPAVPKEPIAEDVKAHL